MKRAVVMVAALGGLLVGSVAFAAEIAPVKLLGGPGEQWGGWQNADHIVYAQWADRRFQAYAHQVSTDQDVRINLGGTQGNPGGIDPLDPNRVIYHQWDRNEDADLYYYDLETGERSRVPGLNSRYWDYSARISSRFILYLQERYVGGKWYAYIQLYNRETGATKTIERYTYASTDVLVSGSVGDRYASWSRCDDERCSVYLYDHQRESWTIKKLDDDGRNQFGPAIDEVNGVVYYARSGRGCGANVMIRSLPIGALTSDPATMAALPAGIDTGFTTVLAPDAVGGVVNLNFERWDCTAEKGDIYQLPGVGALP